MSQSSVSVDLTPSPVLPTQSPARAGLDRNGSDFAAHLRQADQRDPDASPTRGVRGGAGSTRREDDQRDTTPDASTADGTTSTEPGASPTSTTSDGSTPTQVAVTAAASGSAAVANGTSATAAPAVGSAPVTAAPTSTTAPATLAAAAGAAATTATTATTATASLPTAPGVTAGGTTPGATRPAGAARSAAAGHGSAAGPATGGIGPEGTTTTTDPAAASTTTGTGTGTGTGGASLAPADPSATPAVPTTPATGNLPTPVGPTSVGHAVDRQNAVVPTVSNASATASATATAAPAPATTAPQSSVAGQLAASLRTLAGQADGVHVMTVRLHPDELGPVRLVARLTGSDVHLTVTTSTVAAAEAVTAAGPRLHDALAASGLTSTGVNVDHDAGLAGTGAGGQQLGQGSPNSAPDAGSGNRSGSTHQGRGDGGGSGGRHRLDVGPAAPSTRHPSARTLDLHV